MQREIEGLKTKLFRQRIVSYAIIGTLTLTLSLALSIKQLENLSPSVAFARIQPQQIKLDTKKSKNTPAKDRILVKFKEHVDSASERALLHRNNFIVSKEIGTTGVKIVKIPIGKNPSDVVKDIKNQEKNNIEFAETDDLVEVEYVPDDPYYSLAWHLPVIKAPDVWDEVQAIDVLIGNCDTGVLGTHEDLAPILRADLGYNTVDNSDNWQPVHYHGTLTSGASAAVVNNGLGVAGVAIGAKIIPVRISNMSNGNAYVSDAAECIFYTAVNGARAINLSYSMSQYETIHNAAVQAEAHGAITVVSASNNNTDPGWPDFPSFLAVAATDQSDQRASFSNYGTYVDLTAPGVNIVTTHSDGTYAYASGTSLSAPLVTATLALMFGADPDLSVTDAKTILLANTDDIGTPGEDTFFGAGRLNSYKAVSAVLGYAIPSPTSTPTPQATPSPTPTNTPSPTPTPTATPVRDQDPPTVPTNLHRPNDNGVDIPLQWDSSSDYTGVSHYNIFRNGSQYATSTTTVYFDQNTSLANWYEYYITAVDFAGNESDPSNTVAIAAADTSNGVFFGTVSDSEGSPITGASISVKRALKKKSDVASSQTDANGRYSVPVSESNDYKITVSGAGYNSSTSDQVTLSPQLSKVYNFTLYASTKGNSGNKGKNK